MYILCITLIEIAHHTGLIYNGFGYSALKAPSKYVHIYSPLSIRKESLRSMENMWQHQELLLACRSSFMECVTAKDVDIKNSKDAKKKFEI